MFHFQLIVLLVGLVAFLVPSLALDLSSIPNINVTLEENGPQRFHRIQVGTPFPLNCTFTGLANFGFWTPVVTFTHNGVTLGSFEPKEKTGISLSVHWVTKEFIPNLNAFPVTKIDENFHSTYSIWIQPLSKIGAEGDYACSVTLRNDYFTQARYHSNALNFQ